MYTYTGKHNKQIFSMHHDSHLLESQERIIVDTSKSLSPVGRKVSAPITVPLCRFFLAAM
jgi:hypothetical protein